MLLARVPAWRHQTAPHSQVMLLLACVPVCRHQIALFANITRITWRLDRPDKVMGTVSDLKSGDIRFIDLDPGQASDFELVNRVWEVL